MEEAVLVTVTAYLAKLFIFFPSLPLFLLLPPILSPCFFLFLLFLRFLIHVFSLATLMYLAIFRRRTPNAKEMTCQFCFILIIPQHGHFSEYTVIWAPLYVPAMYGQDSWTVCTDLVLPRLLSCTKWCPWCRKLSLRTQHPFPEFSSTVIYLFIFCG